MYELCLANGFQPWTNKVTKDSVRQKMTAERSWGKRFYTQLYSHGGRSITRIPSTQSRSAGSKLVSASGPLCPRSHPSLCPRCCHHSSLCSALLQPCSCAGVSPTTLGRALHRESVTVYCPHVCSESANQGQVRILGTGTFTLYTGGQWGQDDPESNSYGSSLA